MDAKTALEILAEARKNRRQPRLSGADLSGARLSHADLSRADLSHADLSGADLSHANLSGARLSHANLSGARLSRANLWGARLSHARLSRADLSGADLSHADLSHANLNRADCLGVNFYGADLGGTCLDPAGDPNGNAEGFLVQGGYAVGYRTRSARHIGQYRDGRYYSADPFSVSETECHPGLYLWPSLEAARKFSGDVEFISVRTKPSEIHHAGTKWRCRWFCVLGSVPGNTEPAGTPAC